MTQAALELTPRLDLTAVGDLKTAILAHRGADLTLDAGKVEHMGALAVQLIRSAARSWAEDGQMLTLENPSNDLIDQLGLMGFTPETLTTWEPAS